MSWSPASTRQAAGGLSAAVQTLAKDFRLLEGKVLMPAPAFKKWKQALGQTPPPQRALRITELLALAAKFIRLGGLSAAQASGQLVALAEALKAAQ